MVSLLSRHTSVYSAMDMHASELNSLIDKVKPSELYGKEKPWVTGLQIFVSILLAGYGMVAASLLLDTVQYWEVFIQISELYILVPALLGLKGNLEMTLASRLSTSAHLGHLQKRLGSLVIGNLCLVQCQAVLVGFLASISAMALGWIPDGKLSVNHALVLCASSVLTASLASFLLGLVMITVIVVSTKLKVNPDNVATPIAASLGDLTTLTLLSLIATFLYKTVNYVTFASTIIVYGVAVMSVCGYFAWKSEFTRQALNESWVPVVSAMVISSAGGLILDYSISNYKSIAMFQLVVNGIGGNIVAVHASRLSTAYHTGSNIEPVLGNTSRLLLLMVIPSQLILVYTIITVQAGYVNTTALFVVLYLSAAMLQVLLLLVASYYLVVFVWKIGLDPDNSAIPYLTALGDLLGTAFLGIAFYILYATGFDSSL